MTDAHDTDAHRETPTQGIFVGWLALVLMIFALVTGLVGILAASGVFGHAA